MCLKIVNNWVGFRCRLQCTYNRIMTIRIPLIVVSIIIIMTIIRLTIIINNGYNRRISMCVFFFFSHVSFLYGQINDKKRTLSRGRTNTPFPGWGGGNGSQFLFLSISFFFFFFSLAIITSDGWLTIVNRNNKNSDRNDNRYKDAISFFHHFFTLFFFCFRMHNNLFLFFFISLFLSFFFLNHPRAQSLTRAPKPQVNIII